MPPRDRVRPHDAGLSPSRLGQNQVIHTNNARSPPRQPQVGCTPQGNNGDQHRSGAIEEHQSARSGAGVVNEVNQAKQEKEKLINEARRDKSDAIGRMAGHCSARIF